MKFTDVKISCGCYFEIEDETFDLHNDWDLKSITYEQDDTKVILMWAPSDFARKTYAFARPLRLIFEGVHSLRYKVPDIMFPQGEAEQLEAVGRLHPENEETMNGILPDENASCEFPMIFCFGDGSALKIRSDKVVAEHSF